MTTATQLAHGGNVKNLETKTPAGQPTAAKTLILPIITCIIYTALLIIWDLHVIPQPHLSGNTFHGIKAFADPQLVLPSALLAAIPGAFLTHRILCITLPANTKARDATWLTSLITGTLFASLTALFITTMFMVNAASRSDLDALPNDPAWLGQTLHVNQFKQPTKDSIVTAKTAEGKTLTLAYKQTPTGYTLTLLKTATPKPAFQLPGTAGTVHTKDSTGKPLTYTYTRDKNGDYTINTR